MYTQPGILGKPGGILSSGGEGHQFFSFETDVSVLVLSSQSLNNCENLHLVKTSWCLAMSSSELDS